MKGHGTRRCSWIVHGCPPGRGAEGDRDTGERRRQCEPRGRDWVTWPRAEGCWQPLELAETGSGFPLELPEGHRPVDTFTAASDFQNREKIDCCWFRRRVCRVPDSSHGRLARGASAHGRRSESLAHMLRHGRAYCMTCSPCTPTTCSHRDGLHDKGGRGELQAVSPHSG